MKIRNGFVSNSSSSSFAIPMSFLTDEQTEMLLFIDDMKKDKKTMAEVFEDDKHLNPVDKYPRNEEYHKIYDDMIEVGEWQDSGWTTSIDPDRVLFGGGTSMWNGTIGSFMEKIGIDVTALQIISPGTVHMPSNPEALKVFAEKRKEQIKWYDNLAIDDWEREFLDGPIEDNPYELDDSEFEDWYGDLKFESQDGYDYKKKLKSE